MKSELTEQEKYEKMYEIEDYSNWSPGELIATEFLRVAQPLPNSTCIDFGCGTGRGGLVLSFLGQMIITLVDFAGNALDEDVRNATTTQSNRISWLEADLTEPLPVTAAYGYCVDVMEHVPPEQVDIVLQNILRSANNVFFSISNTHGDMGKHIGEDLHLTVEPFEWWHKKFRDLNVTIRHSVSLLDEDGSELLSQFYVSSWTPKGGVEYEGKVNTDLDQVLKNIRKNVRGPWRSVLPHKIQSTELMLVAGGPSLTDYTDEIIKLRNQGMPMVTCNGTYNWAIEQGLRPSMQLIVDARKFNKRFVRPIVPGCKYLIASQAHPSVFDGLPPERTYIWHVTGNDEEVRDVLDEAYEIWHPCPGGSTVTLRGLCLLRMLGFHKIHVYGFDSCYRETAHHAYSQPENDYDFQKTMPVSVGGRVFWCDPWMYTQATEFMDMVKIFGDEIDLNVRGDGLIAHIINTGAKLSALEDEE